MANKTDTFKIAGVLHVPPLPGSPQAVDSFQTVIDRVLADAEALITGGIDCAVIENFGDAPFRAKQVGPHVPAMLAVLGAEIRHRLGADFEIGINVLRNDGMAAIGVAAALGASFVRINVFTGAAWTDQGLIEGDAASVTRYRRSLFPISAANRPQIMADVGVKHAVPVGAQSIETLASEAVSRGGADGLIVTGSGTGEPTALDDVRRVQTVSADKPVWVGSGTDPESIKGIAEVADGVIVGTYLHEAGDLRAPISEDRVRSFVNATRS